jgi:formylglycine-generating enzyme required for sulfatase activity
MEEWKRGRKSILSSFRFHKPSVVNLSKGMRQDKRMNLPGTYKNRIGMDFVLIPVGTFMMGSEDGHEDEQLVHTVRITKPFYLGKYMVRQAQ